MTMATTGRGPLPLVWLLLVPVRLALLVVLVMLGMSGMQITTSAMLVLLYAVKQVDHVLEAHVIALLDTLLCLLHQTTPSGHALFVQRVVGALVLVILGSLRSP